MKFIKTKIQDLTVIQPEIIRDERGYFFENYKKSEFLRAGIKADFVQDNYSYSKYRVLRGLHFQKAPYEQAKLVQCKQGRILDIALDLRKKSKTYLKYYKIELSNKNKLMLYIPKGFAHGFVVLSKQAEIFYKTDCEYNKNADCGIIWNDKTLNIDWGIEFEPILSKKDNSLPSLGEII